MFSQVRIYITLSLCLVLLDKILVWHLPLVLFFVCLVPLDKILVWNLPVVFFLFDLYILFARFLLRPRFLVLLIPVVVDFLD